MAGFEERYMRRAIELAKKGMGAVNPNPLVGAVIVKDGKIIGEGYHARYGELHAERAAFASLTEDAEGAEMYVTLEPCSHYGKQPPCALAIIDHRISKVYCGSDDPNAMVAGKGFQLLRDAGIEVETHCLKEECDALNSIFFKFITKKIPYVTMKYAMTMDGKIACRTGDSKWITGEAARNQVQELRQKHVGIMVGIGTVLADDPMLTCRLENPKYGVVRNPVRIVVDTKLSIPLDCQIVNTAKDIETIIVCGAMNEAQPGSNSPAAAGAAAGVISLIAGKKNQLQENGVKLLETPLKDGRVDISFMLNKLGELNIDGILLEGGGTLNYSMLEEGMVDEIYAYIAPKIFGGETAKTPVQGEGVAHPAEAYMFKHIGTEVVGDDVLLKFKH